MKCLLFVCLFCLSTAMNAQLLNDFKWKNRIVIFDAPQGHDWVRHYPDSIGIKERKLLFFHVTKNKVVALFNDEMKGPVPGFIDGKSVFYLIGLDGSVKLKSKELPEQQALFALIDSMPMRANEIRRNEENE